MKKNSLFIILGMIFMVFGCKANDNLIGNWETVALIKEGVAQEIAVSNIELTSKGSVMNAGGCAGVNMFNGDLKFGKKNLSNNGFGVTKMMGEPKAMEFENMFLDVLNNSSSYKLEGDVLTIYSESKNMEIQLRRQK